MSKKTQSKTLVLDRYGSYIIGLLIVFTLVALIGYIFQVEDIITKNYTATKYKQDIQALKENNSKLSRQKSESLSLGTIENKLKDNNNFVKTDDIAYIRITSKYLAQKYK